MPKRIATPPPGDDEPRYLVVHKPYPLNAHWELPQDRITFARWIACVIGHGDLGKFIAFYHKPRARSMVLIEIDRMYDHFDRLLGQHAWAEFLQQPTDEENDKVSQVFYSTYVSMRAAQKEGWKRITVEDPWFTADSWSPKNSLMKFPYPQTHWCQPPKEDQTNKPVCRPLPVSVKPPPERPAPPVVGSAAWVAGQGGKSNSPQALRGAWSRGRGRGGPSVSIPGRGAAKSVATSPVSAKSPASASASNNNAWAQPINQASATKTTPASATSPKSAWGVPSSASNGSPRTPSSATSVVNGAGPRNPTNYAAATKSPTTPDAPPGLEHLQRRVAGMSVSGQTPRAPVVAGVYDEQYARQEGVDPSHAFIATWESERAAEDLDDMLWGAPQASSVVPSAYDEGRFSDGVESWGVRVGDIEIQDSLWDDEDEEEKKKAQEEKEALICRAHGIICKKGICKDYKRQLRDYEKKKQLKDGQRPETNGHGGSENGWSRSRGGRGRGNKGGNWRREETRDDQTVTDDGFSVVRPKGKSRAKPAVVTKSPAPQGNAKGSWADDDGTQGLPDLSDLPKSAETYDNDDPWAGAH
ncbi:hypothetical protein HGRIS_001728 [Hohenbuehelia grisea]|uniref:Uncharacterized protein n=1 Tax=Hohenbuehelia grisea TaxID=104357 RepID=A0ABR3JIB1_9AGAR